jgi:hypothetical protein
MSLQYFLGYVTANDDPQYREDLKNLERLKRIDSGLGNIKLFIAISESKKRSKEDYEFIEHVTALFNGHTSIELIDIYFKSNVGRDFSSFKTIYDKVKAIAGPKDYILFQNRSGFGPFRAGWYKEYTQQFERFNKVAMCGCTINFNDHPVRSSNNNLPHIQTYSFLTKISFLDMFEDPFPGSQETDNFYVVIKGEIVISQYFLNKGFRITCLEWPEQVIDNETLPISAVDIKSKVKGKHFFYHKHYFKWRKLLLFNPIVWQRYRDSLKLYLFRNSF